MFPLQCDGLSRTIVFPSLVLPGFSLGYNTVCRNEKILARLLDEPMTPLQRERHLDCALQEAAHLGKLQLCIWLLDVKGANVNHMPGAYGSPLQAALSLPKDRLGRRDTGEPFLTPAAENNRDLIIDVLLSRGANTNPPGKPDGIDASPAKDQPGHPI
jgi:hypothetical protein